MRAYWIIGAVAVGGVVLIAPGCLADDCSLNPTLACWDGSGHVADGGAGGGTGGSAGQDGNVGGNAGGGGNIGGGGSGGCMVDADCMTAAAADCDEPNGMCVPCTKGSECEGVAGLPACDISDGPGECVECTVGDDDACTAQQTCNVLTNMCVDVAPLDLNVCDECTNDKQCKANFKCIPMNFEAVFHGNYCIREFDAVECVQPYRSMVSRTSLNSMTAQSFCSIAETFATCEAVKSLIGSQVCNGAPGMCGPDVGNLTSVTGALCESVGGFPDRCTYECGVADDCPASRPCGPLIMGKMWCGGTP